MQGIPSGIKSETFLDVRFPTLLIIDDLMKNATGDDDVCELFTEGAHHRNLSVICMLQNIFYKAKGTRTMNLNSQYLVLFKNPRDIQQIAFLARQMYASDWKKFLETYKEAVNKPYGYLLVDLKQDTPESQRLKTDIFTTQQKNLQDYKRSDWKGFCQLLAEPQSVNMENTVAYQTLPNACMIPPVAQRTYPLRPGYMADQSNDKYISEQTMNPLSCIDCGGLFATPFDLQRHVKRGCPMDQDISDTEGKDEEALDTEDDDDSGFNDIVNKVFEKNQDLFERKVQNLMDSENISEKDARAEVKELMLPRDRSLFLKEYTKVLEDEFKLRKSPLHREIKRDIDELMNEESLKTSLAISRVLNQRKRKFDELLEADDSDSEQDEESDNDDETQ
ncbi:MAG: hypothetical protein AB2693_08650 [Candidatus Thiodiazotropha sp.]